MGRGLEMLEEVLLEVLEGRAKMGKGRQEGREGGEGRGIGYTMAMGLGEVWGC